MVDVGAAEGRARRAWAAALDWLVRRRLAQPLVERPLLDAEDRRTCRMLGAPIELLLAALPPADRSFHRLALQPRRRVRRNQLIELHDDVAIEQPLHLDRAL